MKILYPTEFQMLDKSLAFGGERLKEVFEFYSDYDNGYHGKQF